MAEEKLWNVVAFSPVFGEWMVFRSVCRSEETSGLLLASSWTDRRAWLDFMAECVWCVFPVNQDGFLPSISSTSPHLPLPITRSIMLETAQDSTWNNRRRHCTSKWNNIVLQVLFLKNIHGYSKFPYKVFSFSHLPFLITRSITLETTQECTWSNRKTQCASKYNNTVLWILLLRNIHG